MFLTLTRYVRGRVLGNPADARAFDHHFGWSDPRLDPHWARLRDPHRWLHALLNVATEWVRLDAQRAAKVLLDVLAWAAALGLWSLL